MDYGGVEHRTGSHSKFLLRYHLIFVCKYRKKILTGTIGDYVKQVLKSIGHDSNKFSVMCIETDGDHVHMMIDATPNVSPSQIVRRLKQLSTYRLWETSSHLKNEFWKKNVLWSRGYFISTIGDASSETVKKYIETQG